MASRLSRQTKQESQRNEKHNRARWTLTLIEALVKLMVEQVYKGNQHSSSSFSKRAWEEISNGFYRKTCLKFDKDQLKNRCSVLRKQYFLVKSMLDKGFFAVDEAMGTISATKIVWAEFIAEHPDAEHLKTNGFPFYKDLCIIFSEATTSNGHQPEESVSSEHEKESENDKIDRNIEMVRSGSGAHKRGRWGVDGAIANAIMEMAAASRMKTSAIQRRNARYDITKCIKELDAMEGVEESVYFAALDLFNAPSSREFFMSLQGDKRLAWLRSKCVVSSMF